MAISHLILLWAYGIAFCYIASAPILVMHAGRGLLFKSTTNPNPHKNSLVHIAILIASVALIAALTFWKSPEKYELDYCLVSVVFSLIIGMQLILLAKILFFRWESTIQYMVSIINKRKQNRNFEFVETYRHMREHGNAFFIVFFQIALASIIFLLSKDDKLSHDETIATLSLILLAWISPAMIIWLFANKIENHLKEMP